MRFTITRYPILTSTNDLVLECMRAGVARIGDVVVAGEQAVGRGRQGRTWHSQPGALLFTVVLPCFPERLGWMSLATGIAMAQALRGLGVPVGVKWPNDLILEGRKLGGILTESNRMDMVAVGVGINVRNPLPVDPEVARKAARLADAYPWIEPEQVLSAGLRRLDALWDDLQRSDLGHLHAEWQKLDTTCGRRVIWSPTGDICEAAGVDESGALLLLGPDGRRQVARVGEISFIGAAEPTGSGCRL
jgi:BirA family biotin operon repressor/biotin-[acetyl-CoA-carboxylase] ligase